MKKMMILILAVTFAAVLVGCEGGHRADQNQSQPQPLPEITTVSVTRDSKECIGEDQYLLWHELCEAGFLYVDVEAINDLMSSEAERVGVIESVSINGETDFVKGQEFDKESSIVIRYHDYRDCTVAIHVDFVSNWLFNKYDVNFLVDDMIEGTMTHGTDSDFELFVKAGTYTLSFENADDSDVTGTTSIVVDGDTKINYQISCSMLEVNVKTLDYTVLECTTSEHKWVDANCTNPTTCIICGKTEGEPLGHEWIEATSDSVKSCSICQGTEGAPVGKVSIRLSASEYVERKYNEVVGELTAMGFSNIKEEPHYDLYFSDRKAGSIQNISINGISDFAAGDIFDKNAEIIIVYQLPYTEDPSYIKMPHESEYYDGMNYLEVEQQLKDLGFTNIDLDEMPSSYHEDGEVFSVLKGNHPFNEGDAIKNDEEITINYYIAEEPVVLETLTIDNNDQFAALMKITNQTDETTIRTFVISHIGDIIEFDGCIAFVMNHGDYKTRFDVCMAGGDYDSDRVYGPLFAFENVAFNDMNVSGADTVAGGMNFHITAEIKGCNSEGSYIILKPISMKAR